jgi:hypothetical protein
MIVRPFRNPRTVVTPSYHLDLATGRLTIHVPDASLLDLVPATIRRATSGAGSGRTMTIVIDCRRSPSPPALPDICRLAESLADSWDVNEPIALVAHGIEDHVARFAPEVFMSARSENTLRVFADATHMEVFLRRALIPV